MNFHAHCKALYFILLAASITAFVAGCGPNQAILRSAATPARIEQPATPANAFDAELKAMRTADFNFVYVLRRRDSLSLDAADKKAASDNIPVEINRRKLIDDGRAVMIGSNFRLPPENLQRLSQRFAIEDFSVAKPDAGAVDTANSVR